MSTFVPNVRDQDKDFKNVEIYDMIKNGGNKYHIVDCIDYMSIIQQLYWFVYLTQAWY
jgi:hypothetical protein